MRVLGTILAVTVAVVAMAAFYPSIVHGQTSANSSPVLQPVMPADRIVDVEGTVPAFQVNRRAWKSRYYWGGYGGFYPYGSYYPYRSYRYYSWPYKSGCYWNGWTTVCRYPGW